MTQSPYENRYFSILGDSLSTLSGYNPEECAVFYDWQNKCLYGVYTPSDTWWGRVVDALGGRVLVNHAFSGSTVTKRPEFEIPSYGCSDARTAALALGEVQPDVVMVLMGLNDVGYNTPITAQGEGDLSVFSVAYSAMLDKLRANYPRAEIWCLTLPLGWKSREPEFVSPHSKKIEAYCRAIAHCAREKGCRLVDIYDPRQPYDTIDGYHATAEGMATIAQAVLRELEQEVRCYDH